MNIKNKILIGNVFDKIKEIPDQSINTCVTSPPYWGLRDYGNDDQIGLEKTPEEFIDKLVKVFYEVKRVLKDDGTLWVNIGDSYYSNFGGGSESCTTGNKEALKVVGRRSKPKHKLLKPKDLVGIPWMLAFALREPYYTCGCGFGGRKKDIVDNLGGEYCPICGERTSEDKGWYLRQDIIWSKPNPMPESVKDRCTKSHEYVFLLSKSKKYYYDYEAIKEPAAYLHANSSESINSPYGQNIKKYKGNANGFRGGSYCNGNKGNSELGRRTKKGNIHGNLPGRADNGNSCNHEGQITKNKRSVWNVSTKPFKGAHFATFPPELIEPCILAGCPKDGIVFDPFFGAGTTGIVSQKNGRYYCGIELNQKYAELSYNRNNYGTVDNIEVESLKKQIELFN